VVKTIHLSEFRAQLPGLSREERNLIMDQARLVLEENYVHFIEKRKLSPVDPVAACEHLRSKVGRWGVSPESEMMFHEELLRVFRGVSDRHTRYLLPLPMGTATAFLPFTVDIAVEQGRDVAIITEVYPPYVGRDFRPGVRLTHWNGVGIDRLLGFGLDRTTRRDESLVLPPRDLTIRPMRTVPPPAEDWVDVSFIDLSGKSRERRFEWQVVGATLSLGDLSLKTAEQAVDPQARATELSAAGIGVRWSPLNRDPVTSSRRRMIIRSSHGDLGYLFVPTFVTSAPLEFVLDLQSVIAELPNDGLIVDVRGNTGGSLGAATGLAQSLSTERVLPILSQMRATSTNLELCRRLVEVVGDVDLEQTLPELRSALGVGTLFTPLQPLSRGILDGVERSYPGPVTVLFDRFSYSATDVFAAAVQDHAIGPTLSTGGPTGGGGANAWSHDLFCELSTLGGSDLGYEPLPRGAGFTVAMRRLYRPSSGRSGKEPVAIEDVGVRPDRDHVPSRRDVVEAFPDMLEAASALLHEQREGSAGR
jgi:hypothetical protein